MGKTKTAAKPKPKTAAKPHRNGKNKNRFAFTMYVTAKQRAHLRTLAKKKKTTVVGFVRDTLGLTKIA